MKEIHKGFKAVEIPLKDERSYVVDFHALRTIYITRLQHAGVSPREAMELARHSDMRLTMKTLYGCGAVALGCNCPQDDFDWRLKKFSDRQSHGVTFRHRFEIYKGG